MAKEFVYFIASELGPIKIGRAVNIKNRLSGLQTSSPHKLSVLGIVSGDPGLEGILHKQFSDLRQNGEWFKRDAALLTYIKDRSRPFDAGIETEMKHYEERAREEKNSWRRDWEVERQKMKYRDELEFVVTRAMTDIEEKIIERVVERTSRWQADNMSTWVTACQNAEKFIRDIEKFLDDRNLNGHTNDLRIKFRRVVDSALGMSWQDAQEYMISDQEPDSEEFKWSTKAKMRAQLRGIFLSGELRRFVEDLAKETIPEEVTEEEADEVG